MPNQALICSRHGARPSISGLEKLNSGRQDNILWNRTSHQHDQSKNEVSPQGNGSAGMAAVWRLVTDLNVAYHNYLQPSIAQLLQIIGLRVGKHHRSIRVAIPGGHTELKEATRKLSCNG